MIYFPRWEGGENIHIADISHIFFSKYLFTDSIGAWSNL